MFIRSKAFRMPVLVAGLLLPATPAHADAIDGDWCMGGDHMNIDGSTIITPGRNRITGTYGRYRYSYLIPVNEPGAGGEVKMIMNRGRETIHVDRPGGDPAKPEVWTRCKPVS